MAKSIPLILLVGLAATVALWVAVNIPESRMVGIIYSIMTCLGLLLYIALPLEEIQLFWTPIDFFIGAVIGVVIFGLSRLSADFAIATPQIQGLGALGDTLVVVVIAPIIEEFFFKVVLYGMLGRIPLINNPAFRGAITALAFMIFHWKVYGGVNGDAALLGALLFASVTLLGVIFRGNLLSGLTAHTGINAGIRAALTVFR